MANDEAHYSAMSGVTGENSRDNIFAKIKLALAQGQDDQRAALWAEVHNMAHQSAMNLPLWGKRIPAVLNQRLGGYHAGYQQFDYPVHRIVVQSGSKNVTIAPGAQSGLFQSVGRLDPHSYRPNEFFANNWVYEGLTSYGPDGKILPALAQNWTVSGNNYIFTLRAGVKFHDGADWNCNAAKLNFDHVFAPPLVTADNHGWYNLPLVYSNCMCNSNGDFMLTTTTPYAGVLQELSFTRPLRMLSPSSFMSSASDSWRSQNSCPVGWGTKTAGTVTITCAGIKSPAGTGPFKFVSRTKTGDNDAEVVFQQNTAYWKGVPDIEFLIIKRFQTASAVAAALKSGVLDMVAGDGVLTPADLKEFTSGALSTSFNSFWSSELMHSIVILNSGKAPTNDIAVRKAIIHGVDKASIIKRELQGLAQAADTLFPKSAPYSRVELTPRWDYDLEKAKMLNCPSSDASSSASSTSDNSGSDQLALRLGLGLGLGLGIPLLLALIASFFFFRRSSKLDKDLKVALSNKAVFPDVELQQSHSPDPTRVGNGEARQM